MFLYFSRDRVESLVVEAQHLCNAGHPRRDAAGDLAALLRYAILTVSKRPVESSKSCRKAASIRHNKLRQVYRSTFARLAGQKIRKTIPLFLTLDIAIFVLLYQFIIRFSSA
jgi:hypothetical protein